MFFVTERYACLLKLGRIRGGPPALLRCQSVSYTYVNPWNLSTHHHLVYLSLLVLAYGNDLRMRHLHGYLSGISEDLLPAIGADVLSLSDDVLFSQSCSCVGTGDRLSPFE